MNGEINDENKNDYINNKLQFIFKGILLKLI